MITGGGLIFEVPKIRTMPHLKIISAEAARVAIAGFFLYYFD